MQLFMLRTCHAPVQLIGHGEVLLQAYNATRVFQEQLQHRVCATVRHIGVIQIRPP